MSRRSEAERHATEEDLSALADGELEAPMVAQACRIWCDDAQMRSQWHAYHLIGDVMRSEDLSSQACHDAGFLVALRRQLAKESVVLAPANLPVQEGPQRSKARRSWIAPAAVAAGFAIVAGTLVVVQMADGLSLRGSSGDAALADAAVRLQQPVALSEKPASAIPDTQGISPTGQLVRDERLDAYLAAHKKFGGSSLPGGPSGFLRNASVDVPAR